MKNKSNTQPAPAAVAGPSVGDMARILFAAWSAAEPAHSITQNPTSYAATFADMARAALAAAPTTQPAPQQEPSHTAVQLAELVLSDCGHSSNYTPLLDRVAARIDAHVERRLDELRGCLESKPAPQPSPASQGDALDAARYRWLRDSTEWEPFDSAWLNKHDIYGCPTLAMDVAIDAARAAQEGKSHDN